MRLPADTVAKLRTFYEGRSVCVTGGAGFIGGHMIDVLMAVGATVSVIDDLSNSTLEHLAGLIELEPDRLHFFHASILDASALQQAFANCQTVFHLAAVGSVSKSVADPVRSWTVNATGTLRVLEAARAARVERVIAASSSSIYGDQPVLPNVESMLPRPMSPYAVTKLTGEHLLSVWAQNYGLSTASLRYFNVFGPRQSADSQYGAAIAIFAKRLLNSQPARIFGDGKQSRDMTFVSNAVVATLLAGACSTRLTGQAFNIGTGRAVTVLDIAAAVAREAGAPQQDPVFEPARPGEVRHSLADITEARKVLGYEPIATFEEGIKETVAWFRHAYAGT